MIDDAVPILLCADVCRLPTEEHHTIRAMGNTLVCPQWQLGGSGGRRDRIPACGSTLLFQGPKVPALQPAHCGMAKRHGRRWGIGGRVPEATRIVVPGDKI